MKSRIPESRWYETWIGESAISMALGLLVIVLRWLAVEQGEPSPSLETTLATFLGTTVATMIFLVRKRVGKIEIAAREHNKALAAGEETDDLLMQLQARLRDVQACRSAVFKTYCKEELEDFVTRVARAAQQGELIVHEHNFRTMGDVLEAFGETNRVYRGVWKIEEGEPLFDTAWQQYMKELINLTVAAERTKRITVELLLVVDKRETLDSRAVKIVVGYLRPRKKKGLNYRIVTKETYDEFVRDSQLDTKYIDFGVYGEELLYRTETYDPKKGMFSEDKGTIRAYRGTHKAAMGSARALSDPAGVEDHDDLERFLHADKTEDGT